MAQSNPSPIFTHDPARSVAICGGGIAGLATAVLLARDGFSPVVFEARAEQTALSEGAFVTLAPNGMRALAAIGADEAVATAGIRTSAVEIRNHRGRRLARIDQSDGTADGRSITIRRGALATALVSAARRAGADLQFSCPLSSIEENADGVTLRFKDGNERGFDFVIACDGLSSPIRRSLFPESPLPAYSGLVGTGGIVDVPAVPATNGILHMTFGRRAYFGYIKEGDGPVFWFNSYPRETPPTTAVAHPQDYARKIREMHREDPDPISMILSSVTRIDHRYPIFDVPSLFRWHTDRVVLAGDAAHAVAPHAGQGASMALEDAVVLAACLKEDPAPGAAFARFERLRKERARKVMAIARRNGSQKRATGPVALFLRDLLLPVFIPLGVRNARRILTFRVDLEPLRMPVQ